MAEPDRGNAHIRRDNPRHKPEALAEEAQRLLDDPAFIRGFDAVRDGIINELEAIKHDGQATTDDYERELCRTLRTLRSVKRAIALGVQGQQLRLAEYQARDPEQE